MSPPADLVERLEGVASAFSVARVETLAELPGNPLGLEIRRFGHAFAPAARAAPELDFVNRVERLGPREAERFDEILAFYALLGQRPWLELAPDLHLNTTGAVAVQGTHAVLAGAPRADEPRVPTRAVDADEAARLVLDGLEVPPEIAQRHAAALAAAAERAGGRILVAYVDGEPAAAGILTCAGRVGYLALASTLPEYRGRGCQTALIAARVRAAAEAGCDLVMSGAELGSQSQRNLERGGLRVAYTKPVLRISPPPGDARDRGGTA